MRLPDFGQTWLFVILGPIFSYLLLISILPDNYSAFLMVSIKLTGLLLPVLVHGWLRDQGRISVKKQRLIWPFVFLAYPAVAFFLRAEVTSWVFTNIAGMDLSRVLNDEFPLYFFLLFLSSPLAIEVAVFLTERAKSWANNKLSTNKIVLCIGLILSLGICIISEQSWYTLIYWPQLFFMFAIYYGYYLLNSKFLIPKFLREKGIIHYLFSIAALIILTYPLVTSFLNLLPVIDALNLEIFQPANQPYGADRGGLPFMIMIVSAPFIISSRWMSLEKERSTAELELLRQRINPHFFFNTLNNLYALSIDKDERTSEVILQLSEQMRYVIYSGQKQTVPLSKTIQHLEDYVALQRIRLKENCDFKLQLDLPSDTPEVPPLLFTNLVENAFKHGIEPATGPTFLHIDMKLDGKVLTFRCVNSVERTDHQPGGMGLTNLRRRLDLLFPGRHQLKLVPSNDRYLAELTLEL